MVFTDTDDEDNIASKDRFGIIRRDAVTFYQDMFVYKEERVVDTRRCSTWNNNCFFTYNVTAWVMKI